jgi:hypothetical protein
VHCPAAVKLRVRHERDRLVPEGGTYVHLASHTVQLIRESVNPYKLLTNNTDLFSSGFVGVQFYQWRNDTVESIHSNVPTSTPARSVGTSVVYKQPLQLAMI